MSQIHARVWYMPNICASGLEKLRSARVCILPNLYGRQGFSKGPPFQSTTVSVLQRSAERLRFPNRKSDTQHCKACSLFKCSYVPIPCFDVSALTSSATGGCGSCEVHQPQASSAPTSGPPNIEKPDTPKPTASTEDTIGSSDPAVTKPIIQTAASERSRRRKAEWLNMFGMRGELRPSRQASVVSSSHHSLPDVLHDSIVATGRQSLRKVGFELIQLR